MSLNEYIQAVVTAIHKLENYGLAESIEAQSEVRAEKTAVVSVKVILVDKSELHIKEYING